MQPRCSDKIKSQGSINSVELNLVEPEVEIALEALVMLE